MTRKAGRPKAIIDWQQVGKLLEAGCTAVGIAGILGIDESTLRKACERDNKLGFSEFTQQKRSKGDDMLRAKQYQTAMAGNVTMQIWLGKQRLGQSEKSEISGKDGAPIEHSVAAQVTIYIPDNGRDKTPTGATDAVPSE